MTAGRRKRLGLLLMQLVLKLRLLVQLLFPSGANMSRDVTVTGIVLRVRLIIPHDEVPSLKDTSTIARCCTDKSHLALVIIGRNISGLTVRVNAGTRKVVPSRFISCIGKAQHTRNEMRTDQSFYQVKTACMDASIISFECSERNVFEVLLHSGTGTGARISFFPLESQHYELQKEELWHICCGHWPALENWRGCCWFTVPPSCCCLPSAKAWSWCCFISMTWVWKKEENRLVNGTSVGFAVMTDGTLKLSNNLHHVSHRLLQRAYHQSAYQRKINTFLVRY